MNLDSLKLTTSIVGVQSKAGDLSTPQDSLVKKYEQNYSNGTGADQAQVLFADTRTVAGGATDSIDLAGALTHALGGTITFTAIKEIVIVAAAANTVDLLIGEAITNAFPGPFGAGAAGLTIPPGGILHLRNPSAAGWAVTAGTGDKLPVENLGGASADFDVLLVGEGSVS